MKPQIEKVPMLNRMFLGGNQTIVEAQLSAKEVDNPKVLSVCGDAIVTTHECLSGEVSFAGQLNVKSIVCDLPDGLASLNYNVDFANSFKNKNISPDVYLDFVPCVLDVSHKVEGNNICVRCVVETKIYATCCDMAEVYANCDQLNVKKDVLQICNLQETKKHSFTIVDEVTTKDSIGKILSADGSVVVDKTKCDDDVVTLFGNVYTCVTYLHEGKNIKSFVAKTPFDEQLQLKQNCNGNIKVGANVANTKLHFEVEEGADNKTFSIESKVDVCLQVFEQTSQEVVLDAFSLTHDAKVDTKTQEVVLPQTYTVQSGKIGGVLDVNGVDEVLCVTNPKIVVVGCRQNDGAVCIEGLLTGSLLFLCEEQISSCKVEVPFVLDTTLLCNGFCEVACASVSQIFAKVVRGAVSIDAEAEFGINCFDKQNISFVDNVTLLGERVSDDSAICVFVAKKGMTSWDVQKRLGISEQEVLSFNDDATFPLQQDKKILVYKKID